MSNKLLMKFVILIAALSVILVGCMENETARTAENTQNEQTIEADMYVEQTTEQNYQTEPKFGEALFEKNGNVLVKDASVLEDNFKIRYCSFLNIKNAENRFILFKETEWHDTLYFGEVNDDGSAYLTKISDGDVYDADIKTISQGNFIEVYDITDMGYGGLALYDIDEPHSQKYYFSGMVDCHHEGAVLPYNANDSENDYSGFIVDNNGCVEISKVYDGGMLEAEYDDINGDGNTDVIFKGAEKTLDGNNNDNIVSEHYCKYVYIYNNDTDSFDYSEDLSAYISVHKEENGNMIVKDASVLKEIFKIKDCSSLNIKNAENRFILFKKTIWYDTLYYGEVNDDGSAYLTKISYGDVYDADIKTISQGNFIEVYDILHRGNGGLALYDIDEPHSQKYYFSGMVHCYPEYIRYDVNDLDSDYSGFIVGNDGCVDISKVYEGGRLVAEYDDINGDGNTDVIFKGSEKTLDGNNNDNVVSERYCKYVYIYNNDTDSFDYSEDLSAYISVHKEENENVLFEDASVLKEDFKIKDCSSMNIKNAENRFILFKETEWSDTLYYGEVNDDGSAYLTKISGGDVYDADIITISQGNFIEVYNMTHMGNGELVLYDIDEPHSPKYDFPKIVDRHHEWAVLPYNANDSENDYSGFIVDNDGCVEKSKVYENDRLMAEYDDINGDGNTDVIFKGVEKTLDGNNNDSIVSEHYCKYVYIYNNDTDSFDYSEDLSVYEKIENDDKLFIL